MARHRSLNTIRDVISYADLSELIEAELLKGWQDQNVIEVKRRKIRPDNNQITTEHLIITLASSVLQEALETGYTTKICVRPCIPNSVGVSNVAIRPWLAKLLRSTHLRKMW